MYSILYDIGDVFLFQAEDGIRDLVRSRGLGDVYKRQSPRRFKPTRELSIGSQSCRIWAHLRNGAGIPVPACLLYTSDAADERSSVDLGGRRIIKKKKIQITKSVKSTCSY